MRSQTLVVVFDVLAASSSRTHYILYLLAALLESHLTDFSYFHFVSAVLIYSLSPVILKHVLYIRGETMSGEILVKCCGE